MIKFVSNFIVVSSSTKDKKVNDMTNRFICKPAFTFLLFLSLCQQTHENTLLGNIHKIRNKNIHFCINFIICFENLST